MVTTEKNIQALIKAQEPKPLGKDMYGNILQKIAYEVNEAVDYYRMSCDEIEKKIQRLEDRAKKNPEDADDINQEIKDLKAIVKKKKQQNESYLSVLDRLGKVK